jgi:Flp pilus assembly protein TadG
MYRNPHVRQQGAMIITMSIWMMTLVGFVALAVDVGHLMIARNELQNAADAAALAGANCLDKTTSGTGIDCTSTVSSNLNWSIAGTKASSTIGQNKADGASLTDGTVSTGYKNLAGTPGGLQPITLSPVGVNDKPAVMVQLSKASGKNGGPVQIMIAAMFGVAPVSIGASAVAVLSSPGNILPGSVIPVAINKCMYDQFWDSATGTPKIYTGTPVDPYGLSTIGQPWEFKIGSAYHYGACYSGQWTSFDLDVNSQSAIGNLINGGNPSSLAIGDNTWIQPGTKAASYNDLDAKYPTPLSPPIANVSSSLNVTLIVVDIATDLTSKGVAPIVAFAGFHIDDIQGGSGKYIQGHFLNGSTTAGSGGIGPYYGTYTPARLAQ